MSGRFGPPKPRIKPALWASERLQIPPGAQRDSGFKSHRLRTTSAPDSSRSGASCGASCLLQMNASPAPSSSFLMRSEGCAEKAIALVEHAELTWLVTHFFHTLCQDAHSAACVHVPNSRPRPGYEFESNVPCRRLAALAGISTDYLTRLEPSSDYCDLIKAVLWAGGCGRDPA